ncbi:helix-turn-helix domain-containing protein [Halalkalibacter urbisdiaboli]|uniref:helix-turn-helix domain-containing protein n=1 Tax=Halalkalibacter urbisdiaboli TaxID=1960589 RepID=UPI000B44F272|nr:RodZ domain-containing protein [Halalkalibacter urbisdiaboli]
MSELGQHLKEVREQKQISLEDLQRTTKIQKRYLLAIEEGRFDTLPGLFYARAFVKTYAEAIGLDPEPLFDQFRDELPNPRKEAVELPSRSERAKPTSVPNKRKKVSSFMPALISVVFIGVLVVGVWLGAQWMAQDDKGVVTPEDSGENVDADFGNSPASEEEPVEATDPLVEEDSVEEQPEEPEEQEPEEPESVATLSFIETKGITSYFEIVGTDEFDVRVQLSGNSWVDIKNGKGNTFYAGQPSDGEEIVEDFSAEEEILFNFGASQNVTLFINDKEVELPIEKNQQKINVRFSSQ